MFPSADPHTVLGVGPEANDEEIRVAYVRRLKEYPPDRAPEEFERVRDAYELLRDRRSRVRHTLFTGDPEISFDALLATAPAGRRFAGPGFWLAVLKEKNR